MGLAIVLSVVREHGGQLPVAIHRRVIESRRPAFQSPQEVERVEDLLPAGVAASVRGDRPPVTDNLDRVINQLIPGTDKELTNGGSQGAPSGDAPGLEAEPREEDGATTRP